MKAEIVMIGTELLLGQIVDTNASYMGQVLAENGINLFLKTAVGDNKERIMQALDAALDRADVVLTSGGLGPTEDDITRESIAELLNRPLEYREELFAPIEARFAKFKRPLTENNKKQAYAPRGARAIPNPNGTAPGLIVEDARGVIVCMPGVPSELKAMLTDSVIPYLRAKFGITGLLRSRVIKVCGMGESRVDQAMGDLIVSQQNPTVGVLASVDAVRIRITARAETVAEADALIDKVESEVRKRLPDAVMGVNDETIEGVVDGLLAQLGWRMGIVETSTGGRLAARLAAAGATRFAGAAVLPAGIMKGKSAGAALALEEQMVELLGGQFKADCLLTLVWDPTNSENRAIFVHPGGTQTWDIGFPAMDESSQIRASVTALERLRRYLVGLQSSRE